MALVPGEFAGIGPLCMALLDAARKHGAAEVRVTRERIRFLVGGLWETWRHLENEWSSVQSALKMMADLDHTERHRPQSGTLDEFAVIAHRDAVALIRADVRGGYTLVEAAAHREWHGWPWRGPLCPRCNLHVPRVHDLPADVDARASALAAKGERAGAARVLVEVGMPDLWADVYAQHAGYPVSCDAPYTVEEVRAAGNRPPDRGRVCGDCGQRIVRFIGLPAELQAKVDRGPWEGAYSGKEFDAAGVPRIWVKRWLMHPHGEPHQLARKKPCPYCGAPLRSELARQCLACGMDWHDPRQLKRCGKPVELSGPGAPRLDS